MNLLKEISKDTFILIERIFKPPFIAGLIKRSLFERINKSIFAAVITYNNVK